MVPAKERFLQAFQAAGYRLTRQREIIFDYLGTCEPMHPSARQVHRELQARDAGISVATVYNTLGTLQRLGLIKVIEFESLDNRYEMNLKPHINLICNKCGNIKDFEAGPEIHVRCAKEKAGFKVDDFRLEYYGHCPACLAEADTGVTRNIRD